MTSAKHPIIVFDAQCVLCSANAQFVLRHDTRGHFRLASMQGEVGSALYRNVGIDPGDPETLLLVEGDSVLRNSDAVLATYSRLGWPWRAMGVFRLVPRPVRDAVYRLVARNRYRLFGRHESCWVPRADQAERIL
ncbi:thiol-disulfide oxidoreductase DCC family protein [Chelativorans salis]|uniref:Thiol-disulfide oxidoreductase DCC family protein n=1 Tax=Chelativorans salis TaxID=2978478 RepID=A0ABT2LLW8_9HYPH|nr:thiol-disulfide oxidoreductase DCC family protein [Chelativorans sp. EGI FJ00035]MCT7374373.1 thiol-disulfide oxidoreductase DCC family protein [Chelativorans sp. EGI FJ00035]